MRSFMSCVKCGKGVVKKYGGEDLCNLCYLKGLNLSDRAALEIQKLKDELKEVKATLKKLRSTLFRNKVSLQTAAQTIENLKANHRASYEWDRERINQFNKEQSRCEISEE